MCPAAKTKYELQHEYLMRRSLMYGGPHVHTDCKYLPL
jgi:hypothetical protein